MNKKITKAISVFLAALLLVCSAPLNGLVGMDFSFDWFDLKSSAESEGYYTYSVSYGTATITGVDALISGDVTIPSTLGGYPVTFIQYSAFSGCTGLTGVTITDSIIHIGDKAFSGCTGLTSITVDENNTVYDSRNDCNAIIETSSNRLIAGCNNTVIPSGVTSIENYAFYGCTGLTEVTIPDSVTSVGDNAFYGCTGLTEVTIPDSVTSIGYRAFDNTEFYNKATNWENDVLYIGNHLIKATASITGSYTIKAGTICVASHAFMGCIGLTEVTIPDSVTSIGQSAFYGCTGLTEITIPYSIIYIESQAFEYCLGLTSITVDESNTKYDSRNNCNAIIETSTNKLIKGCNNTVIPSGVTSIGWNAFYNCSGLTEVTIPESVTEIGGYAFYNCTGLTEITIPDSIIYIEGNAFECCSGLTSITVDENNTYYDSRNNCNAIIETSTNKLITGCNNTVIPSGVTSIGWSAFYNCSGLTEVTIPESVTDIGGYAFRDCAGLTEVTIPDSVTVISDYAFYNCSGLTSITVDENNTKYDSRNNCNAIIETSTNKLITGCNNTVIPSGVTSIGKNAFYNCSGLTEVTIPDSVTDIGSYAFYNCAGLTEVTIPDSVTDIGYNAFYCCAGLTELTIGKGLISLGDEAFGRCYNLSSITVDESNTKYDSRNNCNAIIETSTNKLIKGCNSTVIPNSVTSIGKKAFSGCIGLTDITIPGSVTNIEEFAFFNCASLTEVIIPEGVTSIGRYAFSDCYCLTSVILPKSLTVIEECAFYYDLLLEAVTVLSPDCKIESRNFCCPQLKEIIDKEKSLSAYYIVTDYENHIGGKYTEQEIEEAIEHINHFYEIMDEENFNTDIIIRGYANSTAFTYAENNGFLFSPFEDTAYVTIHGAKVVDSAAFSVYGVANPCETITIYDNDVQIGTALVDGDGKWKAALPFENTADNTSHTIKAVISHNEACAEATTIVTYNSTAVILNSFELNCNEKIIDILKSRSQYVSVVTSKPLVFTIELNKNNATSVKVIGKKGDVVKTITAGYNEISGAWVARGWFGNDPYFSPDTITVEADGQETGEEFSDITFLIDPSGYVYEAVKSNRVEGATAVICYKDATDNVYVWDCNKYEQDNPQITDVTGTYHWDVLEGNWQVKVTKVGYADSYSEWMTVPPEYTEVAIALVSYAAPSVLSVEAKTNGAYEITFDKYMKLDTVNTENILMYNGETPVACTITPANKEVSGTDENVEYASVFTVTPVSEVTDITIKTGVKSYADVSMESEYTEEVDSVHIHTYGETAYVWNSLTCTATRTCTVCDENTQGHTETETKQGVYVKDTNASCTAAEKGHYEVTFDNASLGSAKTEKDSATNGSALSHTDNNGDGKCDSCGYQMSDPAENCTCKCHQSGFNGFLWKIMKIFYKLFGTKQYCACGAKHW